MSTAEEPGTLHSARWGLIVLGASPDRGVEFLAARGTTDPVVLTVPELMRQRRRLPTFLRQLGVDALMLYSADWRWESYPRLYELVMACAPVRGRYVADGRTGIVHRVTRLAALRSVLALPIDVTRAAGAVAAARRDQRRRAALPELPMRIDAGASGRWVLAVWRGMADDTTVGGSITHAAGIFRGFQECGLRVAVVTARELPPSLANIVDRVSVLAPLARSERLVRDVEELVVNRRLRDAALELASAVDPWFVYQRHRYLLTAGLDVAQRLRLPLVLEWNASELWTRRHWWTSQPLGGMFTPFAVEAERVVVERSSVVAAVSAHAASMAVESGARRERTHVIPNGVDMSLMPGEPPRTPLSPPVRLGWVGTFGPWHGAEVAVEAMAQLPEDVCLTMIGEGRGKADCEGIADSLGIRDRVRFTGRLPHDEVVRELARCDILVSPHVPVGDTPFFGSPTKIFEYMALRRPIVASRLEQIGEVLEDRRTAVLVEPGNVDDLARGVRDVLARDDAGQSLAEAAYAEAAARHSWVSRARQIIDLLTDSAPATVGDGSRS